MRRRYADQPNSVNREVSLDSPTRDGGIEGPPAASPGVRCRLGHRERDARGPALDPRAPAQPRRPSRCVCAWTCLAVSRHVKSTLSDITTNEVDNAADWTDWSDWTTTTEIKMPHYRQHRRRHAPSGSAGGSRSSPDWRITSLGDPYRGVPARRSARKTRLPSGVLMTTGSPASAARRISAKLRSRPLTSACMSNHCHAPCRDSRIQQAATGR